MLHESELENSSEPQVYPGSKTPGAGRLTDTRDRHTNLTNQHQSPPTRAPLSRVSCEYRVNVHAPYHATPDRGQKYRRSVPVCPRVSRLCDGSPRCLFTVKKTPGGQFRYTTGMLQHYTCIFDD
jgi:hypothetical protein